MGIQLRWRSVCRKGILSLWSKIMAKVRPRQIWNKSRGPTTRLFTWMLDYWYSFEFGNYAKIWFHKFQKIPICHFLNRSVITEYSRISTAATASSCSKFRGRRLSDNARELCRRKKNRNTTKSIMITFRQSERPYLSVINKSFVYKIWPFRRRLIHLGVGCRCRQQNVGAANRRHWWLTTVFAHMSRALLQRNVDKTVADS